MLPYFAQCLKGTISLPYFVLTDEASIICKDPNNPDPVVCNEYRYPDVSENRRLEALLLSLHANQFNVGRIDPTRTINHFCEFSGGGDIGITDNTSSPLIVVVPTD